MAYLADQDEELQKTQTAGGAPVANAPQSVGTGSGTIAGGEGTSASATSPAGGSGWVNLGRYVEANKDASTGLADTVTGNVDNRVKGFSDAGAGLTSTADSQAKAASNDGLASTLTNGIKSNPASVNPNDYKSFQAGNYGGPKTVQDVQGYGDFTGAYKTANDAVSHINDRDTQGDLLAETYGKGRDYGSGGRLLDTSILNADANNQARLKATADKYSGLGDQYTSINNAINGNLAAAGTQYDQNKTAVSGALNDTRSGIYAGVDSHITQPSDAFKTAYADSQKHIADTYNTLGNQKTGVENWMYANGLGGKNYLHQTGNARSAAMTNDERSRLNALSQLDGTGAESNPYTFDNNSFMADLARGTSNYKK